MSTQPQEAHTHPHSSHGKSYKSIKSSANQSPTTPASTGETKSPTLDFANFLNFLNAFGQAKDDYEFKLVLQSLSDNLNNLGDGSVTKFVTQFNVNYEELLKLLAPAQGGGGRKMKGGAVGVQCVVSLRRLHPGNS